MGHNNIDLQQLPVEDRNNFILGHFIHTWRGRISDGTLSQHGLNIQYFMDAYLNYGAVGVHDEPRSVDQVTAYDVYDFITDWLPRQGGVASARRVKSYLASFNRLYQFMGEHGYMPAEKVEEIRQRIKWDRQEMIKAVVTYDDEPGEDQSHDTFLAELKELETRWKSLPQPKSDQ